jgi:hypothetical protein
MRLNTLLIISKIKVLRWFQRLLFEFSYFDFVFCDRAIHRIKTENRDCDSPFLWIDLKAYADRIKVRGDNWTIGREGCTHIERDIRARCEYRRTCLFKFLAWALPSSIVVPVLLSVFI